MAAYQGKAHRILAAPAVGPFQEFADSHGAFDEFLDIPGGDRFARVRAGLFLAAWIARERQRITSIHAQALTGLNLVAPGATITGIPVVVRVSDAESSSWGRLLGPIIGRTIRHLKVAPVSEAALEIAIRHRVVHRNEAVVIPNPVDPDDVRALHPVQRSGGAVRVGFLGNPTYRKGWDVLLEVARLTVDLDLVWKLFMSDRNPQVEQETGEFPPGRFEIQGRLRRVSEAYAECDIVFVPSRAESFGRVVAESMVNGIPVLASDLQPVRAMLESDAGLLFEPGDAVAAASQLRRLIDDEELRARLGAVGREKASEFEPQAIARRMASLYGIECD